MFLRLLSRRIEYDINKNEHVFEEVNWIHNWFREPPSLRFCCRKAIRNKFGKQLTRYLRDLEYPKALKDYIRTITL